MRILHVFDHSLPEQSGYAFRSAAILREQGRLGWETIQLTGSKQQKQSAAVETVDGLQFFRTRSSGSVLEKLPVLNQLEVVRLLRARLREIVALTKPDLIHAHSPCLNGLAALGLGKPLVYELRSSWEDAAVSSGTTREYSLRYRASRALETYVLRRADAIVTICEGLRQEVLQRGIPGDRVTVVANAVDPDAFSKRPPNLPDLRRRWGLEGKYVLGFIGSFFAWEGLSLIIEALPQILAARPDVRLLLVGGGPDEVNIRAAIVRRKLEEHVIFPGRVHHEEVPAVYDAVDLLVYPRVPIRLTEMVTPLKPLEAMALGKVFVASDVGGHRELVRDGVTGVLFPAGDVRALASAVLTVAGDISLQQRLAAAGPRFVREERTWARVVRNYEEPYRRLVPAAGQRAVEARAP